MRHSRLAFCSVTVAIVAAVAALTAQETIDRAVVARIRAEATERSKVLEVFNYITNVTGSRPTGSTAHKKAADYVRAKMGEWGLTNSHLEAFPYGRGWELQKFTLELTTPRYFPMYGYPQMYSPSTKGVLAGAPIYLGDKTAAEIEAMGEKLRGAIVLPSPPQTVFATEDRLQPADTDKPVRIGGPEPTTERQAQPVTPANTLNMLLRRFGAGAVLRPSGYTHGTAGVGATNMGGARSGEIPADAVPSVTVVAEHYNMVVRMVQAGAAPQLRLELRTAYQEADPNSYNVIAEIPGEDPVLKNEIVLVGAHLDSWHAATGATDNADGAATAVEAMRILKAIGVHPRRTIRVAIWSGEEVGFLGGRAYVEKYLTDAASRDALSVYLNNDPGTGATYGWYMANNSAARTIFDEWVNQLKDLGLKRNVMESNFTSEDGVFDGVGIPAFTTIMDYANYDARTRHTNADFFEAVSERDLQQSSAVMAVFAYQAAMRDQKIPRRLDGVPATPGGAPGRGGRGGGQAPGGRGGGPGARGVPPPPAGR